MFKRAPRIRPVRRYPMPGYPVIDENGLVLFAPPHPFVASDLMRPILPLALASVLARSADAASAEEPRTSSAVFDGLEARDPVQSSSFVRHPRHSMDLDIAMLMAHVRRSPADAFVQGDEKAVVESLTEEQGRQILIRFFRKNGLLMKSEAGGLDGYQPDRRIGFEFLDFSGQEDGKLRGRDDLDRILVVKGSEYRSLRSPQEGVRRLQLAVEDFLRRLEKEGKLWRLPIGPQELSEKIRQLGSTSERDAAQAAGELAHLGPDVLEELRKHPAEQGVQKLIRLIIAEQVEPLFRDLDEENPEKREAATNRLIELNQAVARRVRGELAAATEQGRSEAAGRCRLVLETIGKLPPDPSRLRQAILQLEGGTEEAAAMAAAELKDMGPDALAGLRPRSAIARVQEVIRAITAAHIAPLLADLNSEDLQKRDAATTGLIDVGEAARSCVEEELKKAEAENRPQAAARCRIILEAVGD